MKTSLSKHIKGLSEECDKLETGDDYRKAELNQVRTAISLIQEGISDEVQEVIEIYIDIQSKLSHLRENRNSAGNHEQFRVTDAKKMFFEDLDSLASRYPSTEALLKTHSAQVSLRELVAAVGKERAEAILKEWIDLFLMKTA